VADRFTRAADALTRCDGTAAAMTGPLLDAVGLDGVSISTMGEFLGTETLAASDDQVARVDELQFDLGEGPCWDALALGRAVLEPDIRATPRRFWPAFSPAIAQEEVGAIFAFPLLIGPLRVGGIDMYSTEPRELTAEDTAQTEVLAGIVGRHVLRRALREAGGEDLPGLGSRTSRRAVHQATGMVIAQLGISADDAHLLIQGRAFAEGRPMRDVAEDVLARTLIFTVTPDGIEEDR
jgi:GAF domain-containing protein